MDSRRAHTVPVSGKVIDASDMASVVNSALDGWFGTGRHESGLRIGVFPSLSREMLDFVAKTATEFTAAAKSGLVVA